jgi:hypothetical protein
MGERERHKGGRLFICVTFLGCIPTLESFTRIPLQVPTTPTNADE